MLLRTSCSRGVRRVGLAMGVASMTGEAGLGDDGSEHTHRGRSRDRGRGQGHDRGQLYVG
jgi:hypothetical protein